MALKAKVAIEAVLRNGRTVLAHGFCSSPFKIANITEGRQQAALRLMLMSSSPGVLDDDEYEFRINVGEGAALRLETQSYQRIFGMKSEAAQNTVVALAEGASLVYLPHPVVPHEDAAFTACNRIDMERGSSLLWGEVISCGRVLNDEVFRFRRYRSLTEIYRNRRLAVRENFLLQPARINLSAIGQLEGYTHQATLLYLHDDVPVDILAEHLAQKLSLQKDLLFGVSALPVNGLVVRVLGRGAEALFQLQQTLSSMIESFQSLHASTVS